MPEPTPEDNRTQESPARPELSSHPRLNTGSASAEPPPAGLTELIGRFELRAVLGEGAFGRVYRAFDPDLQREVAIKIPKIPLGQGLSQEFRERFLREARAAATIHHANICPVYEVGSEGDLPYIVMRFVPGSTLATVLTTRPTGFPPPHAAAIVRKLALGVAAAHAQKVIHRDLKPQNIIWDDATREVLITDFGLARIGAATDASAGMVMGTPLYMAPEQMIGDTARVGPLSDVYALGVILYEHLIGKTPFQGAFQQILGLKLFRNFPSPADVRPGLDSRLSNLCMEAMAPEPEKRFPSAKEFATTLGDYLREFTSQKATKPTSGEMLELVTEAEAAPAQGRPTPAKSSPTPSGQSDTPPIAYPEWLNDYGKGPQPPSDTLDLVIETVPGIGEENPADGTEILVCPRCGARMQAQVGRLKAIDCPLCTCAFSIAAGRQAAGRQSAPLPVARPVAPLPPRSTRHSSKRSDAPRHRERSMREGEDTSRGRVRLLVGISLLVAFFFLGVVGIAGYLLSGNSNTAQSTSKK